jgi:hypothetical protein
MSSVPVAAGPSPELDVVMGGDITHGVARDRIQIDKEFNPYNSWNPTGSDPSPSPAPPP